MIWEREQLGASNAGIVALEFANDAPDFVMRAHKMPHADDDLAPLNRIPDNNLVSPRHSLEFEVLLDKQSNVTRHLHSPEYVSPCNWYVSGKKYTQGTAATNFLSFLSGNVTFVTDEIVGDHIEHSNREPQTTADRDDERPDILRVGDIEVFSAHLDGDRIINENRLHSSTLIFVEDARVRLRPPFRSFALAPGSAPVTTPRCASCGAVLCGCADSAWAGR